MLRIVLNKHQPKNRLQRSHLTSISQTIQVRRAKHVGHGWGRKTELVSNVLLQFLNQYWPTSKMLHSSVLWGQWVPFKRLIKTYGREREREIQANLYWQHAFFMMYIYIYIYIIRYIYIYIYIYNIHSYIIYMKSKVGDRSWGQTEGSLINSYYTDVLGRVLLFSQDCFILPLMRTL